MKIETKIEPEGHVVIISEFYSGLVLETNEGKRLNICLRDNGFDCNIDGGIWHHIDNDKDFTSISEWKPINGEMVWIKVFSNWSHGTYIGLDEDRKTHLVREPKEGGYNLYSSNQVLPYSAFPNEKQPSNPTTP